MNARFTVLGPDCGEVVLTLKPGQTLRHYHGWSHEEGWSSREESWHLDKHGMITRWTETDGTDCDGRLSQHLVTQCHILRLTANHWTPCAGGEQRHYPDWQRVSEGQRDYAAEAAGY